ncbi:MAG: XRE family transcriptional regulator [Oscillospiraceae bacterium]|nr:XRE family transcriptional regulator [Oscillospiraceae bacterium]
MNISIGPTLSLLRKDKKLMQKDVASRLSDYGFNVRSKTIYNWEKELSQPSIPHFIALCDILDVDDVLWQFAGIPKGPYAGLNTDGRRKAREFIDLLFRIDDFKTIPAFSILEAGISEDSISASDTSETTTPASSSSITNINSARSDHSSSEASHPLRLVRLYDIPVSAGAGNFLDESGYEEIEAPSYVPIAVDFALRVSGDSMEPYILDGQVIWVKEQDVLDSGEIGIFSYSGDVYCKKLIADGRRAYLRSLNPSYEDIEVKEDFGFKVIGKVV